MFLNLVDFYGNMHVTFTLREYRCGGGGGGGGGLLASGIHISNLLTNYREILHEIRTVHEYYSQIFLPNYSCIIIIELK